MIQKDNTFNADKMEFRFGLISIVIKIFSLMNFMIVNKF
jgi:hypothetical protein